MPALDFPASPTINDIYSANNVTYICTGTNPSVWKKLGSDISTGTTKVAVVRDRKDQNISAGWTDKVAVGGNASWNDRDLTVKDDPSNFVTLYPTANGQTTASRGKTPGYFSLPAGTYKIRFKTGGMRIGEHTAALVWSKTQSDISSAYDPFGNPASGFNGGYFFGTTATAFGNLETGANPTYNLSYSTGSKVVTISETHYFKVIHYNDSNPGYSWAWGSPINTGASVDENNYTIVEIEDLSTAVRSGSGDSPFVLLSEKSATGTSVEFTDVPADALEITVMFNGVSCDANDNYLVQLGTSSGYITTGYNSSSEAETGDSNVNGTAGFIIFNTSNNFEHRGSMIINKASSNSYTEIGQFKRNSFSACQCYGALSSVSGTVDRLKILLDASASFDAGTISVSYKTSSGGVASAGTTKVAVLQDVRTEATNGGTATAANWHGRRLNTKLDPTDFVTLLNGSTGIDGTANTFSLEAGTYFLQWRAPGFDAGKMIAKMAYTTDANYNTLFNSQSSAGVSYLSGETAQTSSGISATSSTASGDLYATGSATITITQTTYFRLQHYVSAVANFAPQTLGRNNDITGEDEIYSQVIVQDLETAVKTTGGFDNLTVLNKLNIGGDIGLKHDDSGILGEITGGGIYKRVIEIDDSAQGNSQYVDQIQALFRIGQVHGSFAGTLYVTINDQFASMSKVYHFVTTAGGSGAWDRIRTIAGTTPFGGMNFGAGIKYISTYSRDLCVQINYTKSTTQNGPESPKISATLILAQNSTNISVEKPTQGYSISSGLTVTADTVPSASNSRGMKGEMASDSNYLYVCTDTNTWKRIALSSY